MVGTARGGLAVCVEPAPDLRRGYTIQWLRSKRRQELLGKDVSHALPRRWLVPVEVGLFPRAGDETAERWHREADLLRLAFVAGCRG